METRGNTKDYSKKTRIEEDDDSYANDKTGYSINKLRTRLELPAYNAKKRVCLSCGVDFLSEHVGNRLCERCAW
jgi:ribosomal protein S27AE